MNRIICIFLFAAVCATSLQAQGGDSPDGATVKGDKVYCIRGDNLEILADNLQFPFDVKVITNGNFTVAKGKERRLLENQVIRSDGWLLNPDGSIQPVFDHVAMKEGRVLVVRDGQATTLTKPMVFPNHLYIDPDGSCVYPSGSRSRLMDGQLFRLDGTPILSKDTVTLRNGRVVVQRDGTLIPLSPIQIMGMNDGSRVQGDGFVRNHDGTVFRLREGRTIFIDGALVRR